jgi:hypothetical protein
MFEGISTDTEKIILNVSTINRGLCDRYRESSRQIVHRLPADSRARFERPNTNKPSRLTSE